MECSHCKIHSDRIGACCDNCQAVLCVKCDDSKPLFKWLDRGIFTHDLYCCEKCYSLLTTVQLMSSLTVNSFQRLEPS